MNWGKIVTFADSIVTIISGIQTIFAGIKGYVLYAIISGIITLFLLVYLLVRFFNRADFKFARMIKYSLNKSGSYFLRHREIYYEYVDRATIKHSKQFEAQALSDGFDTIHDRYVFSGSSICRINAPCSGQRIVEEYRDLGVNFYSIKSSTPYRKNERVLFKMEMDTISDPNHEAKPFLSTGIYEATKHLKMQIVFGKSVTPHNPKLLVFRNYVERVPIRTKELQFDTHSRTISFEEEYPGYGYKYLISWAF